MTRSYRTVRGRSVCVAVLDELAFWRDDDSANPESEVLNAVRASMATFGSDAMVIAGSSPYAKRGVLWDAFKRYYGKDDARNLVWRAATRTMNPTVPQEFIDAEFECDPISANSEYFAEFRSDIAAFVDLAVLEACTADGVFEIPPVSGNGYVAFCDPSGGSSDSMTLAIAHRDDGVAVLDCVREVRAPFQPEAVVDDFCTTLASYGVAKVTGDRYADEWPREQFKKHNVDYVQSERVKSDIYRDALPLLNSRKCQLLDIRRLISQLHGLKRRTVRGGKDSIDHGPGQHDDVANAVAGAIVLAAHCEKPLNFHVPITGPSRSEWMAAAGFGQPGGGLPLSWSMAWVHRAKNRAENNGENEMTSDVQRARDALANLESKLEDALDRRGKTAHEISRACAEAETAIGINSARNSLPPLNKQARAIDSEIALLRIDISHARRALELAEAYAENVKAKTSANANAGVTADKWFEISCPDGRKIRRRGASLESVQVGLQQGYRVVGRVFGANEDGTGGIVSSPGAPSMLKALLESQGDELLAFLADHGIVGADKQTVVVLPTNNRESVQ